MYQEGRRRYSGSEKNPNGCKKWVQLGFPSRYTMLREEFVYIFMLILYLDEKISKQIYLRDFLIVSGLSRWVNNWLPFPLKVVKIESVWRLCRSLCRWASLWVQWMPKVLFINQWKTSLSGIYYAKYHF